MAAAIALQAEEQGGRRERSGGDGPLPRPKSPNDTVVAAVEGRLPINEDAKLKAALIESEYERAALSKSQRAKVDFELAWAELNNTIALFRSEGKTVEIVALTDGRPAVVLGQLLTIPLPMRSDVTASLSTKADASVPFSEQK